ncbi:major facilitator superfamily permease [Klebsiella michiganensis]|nr:major facilitator superfamily permease [Klebsiella michiganensis]
MSTHTSSRDDRSFSAPALLVAGAFFMEFLDGTVIATALPDMAKDFGVTAVDLNIGISAYLITLAVLIPASGWIADRFGARKIFTLALAIFTLASVFCGLSTNVDVFVAMRILQGIGGALMVPVGRLAVLRTTPKHQLIKAIATLTWPALVAPIIGPPLGGFITRYASWHWIFFINVPLGLIAIALSLRIIPNIREDEQRPFDLSGFVATSVAMVSLVAAMELLGDRQPLGWQTLALLALGLGCMLFALRHFRRTRWPMVRLDALKIPTFRVTMYGGSLFRASISAVPFLLPLLFQVGFGMDPFHSGLLVLAVFVGNLTIKPLTTPLIRWLGFRRLLLINGALNVLSLLACAFFNAANAGLADLCDSLSWRGLPLYPVYRHQHARVCRCAFRANELRQYPVQHRVTAGRGAGHHARRDRYSSWGNVQRMVYAFSPAGHQLPPVVYFYRGDLPGRHD